MGQLKVPVMGCLLTLAFIAPPAQAADIEVTTTFDDVGAGPPCSLREAVTAAVSNTGAGGCTAGSAVGVDNILLGPTTYGLARSGPDDNNNDRGDLDMYAAGSIRVAGRGPGSTIIDGNAVDRVFDLLSVSFTIENLTVRGGKVPDAIPGPLGGAGGAIRSLGPLTVRNVVFSDNAAGRGVQGVNGVSAATAGGAGGAIYSEGPLTVTDSTFDRNRAGVGGLGSINPPLGSGSGGPGAAGGPGGAIATGGGQAAIARSTFSNNRAGEGGGGGADIGQSSFGGFGGLGGSGGAIYTDSTAMTVENSTFAGNGTGDGGTRGYPNSGQSEGGSGGAISRKAGASVSVTYSTFTGNKVGTPPGFANGFEHVKVGFSILADAAPACLDVTSLGPNLGGDPGCPEPRLAGNPLLGPLAANGGPTPSLLPGTGSAAFNALAGATCPATDQRGFPRPQFGACDAGAVEIQPVPPKARSFTSLTFSVATFRAAARGASIAAKKRRKKPPVGTTVRYKLDAAGLVTFTVKRKTAGRRTGARKRKRCAKPTRKLRGKPRCTRLVKLRGSFTHAGRAGANSFRFTGRLRGRKLAPGRYVLVGKLPPPATGSKATMSRAFRIVRR